MAEPIVLGIVGIKNMGEYSPQIQYEKLNVVTYQGSSYCAKKDTLGNLPTNTTYWDLLAQKGDKGDTGDTGSQGPRGPKGETGNPGASPIAVSTTDDMTDTTKIYVLTTDGHWYYYDGDSWEDGGTYQSTGISDNSINYEKFDNDTYIALNLVKPTYTLTEGYYIYSNGSVSSNGSYQYSSPIHLKQNQGIMIRTKGTSGAVAVISEYIDSSYYPVVVTDTSDPKTYYYIPEHDCYVALSGKKELFTNIVVFDNTDLFNTTYKINEKTIEYTENAYISIVDGSVISHNSYHYSNYIPVLASADLTISTYLSSLNPTSSSEIGVIYYDYEKKFISGTNFNSSLNYCDFTTPSNTCFIRFSVKKEIQCSLKYDNLFNDLENNVDNINKNINDLKIDKNNFDFSLFSSIGVLGDSYAAGNFGETPSAEHDISHLSLSWPAMLERKYGSSIYNLSVGGQSTRSFISTGKLTELVNHTKQELYLLVLERNDYNIEQRGESGYLGAISDITGHSLGNYPDTFYGNYATIIETILNYSSGSKLIMISGDYLSNNTLGTSYNEAMEDIAEYYNIPIIKELDDPYFTSSAYRQNRPDGGHPGAKHYNGMLNAISRLYNKCVTDNPTYFQYINPTN